MKIIVTANLSNDLRISPQDLDWAQRHNVKIQNGKFILYHGTRNAAYIRKAGYFKAGTFFTDDPSYASHAPTGSPSSTNTNQTPIEVMRVLVDPNLIWAGVHCQAKTNIPLQEI